MTVRIEKSTITGARELARVLDKLPDKIGRKVVVSSMRQAANLVRKEIRARAPVRAGGGAKAVKIGKGGQAIGRLPGFLRAHIAVNNLRRARVPTLRIGPTRDAFHGLFQEFGTVHHPAQPFIRPAFDAAKARMLGSIGKRLGINIEKAAVKLAGSFAKSGLKSKRRRRR